MAAGGWEVVARLGRQGKSRVTCRFQQFLRSRKRVKRGNR